MSTVDSLAARVAKLEGVLGRGNFNSSSVQQKDAQFNGRFGVVNRTALPAVCMVGEIAILNGSAYTCKTANVWQAVGAVGFGGVVPASGTGATLPSGWSVSLNGATHVYTITHNLGTTSYAVVVSVRGTNAFTNYIPQMTFNSNTFVASFSTTLAATANTDWTFVLTLI